MNNIIRSVILGAGGHGRVVADCVGLLPAIDVVGFIDHDPNKCGQQVDGRTILGDEQAIPSSVNALFLGIGNNNARKDAVCRMRTRNLSLPSAIHPRAVCSSHITLGDGTVVMAGAVIQAGTNIGVGAIINTSATVDHDNQLGDFVHIAPGAHLAGNVRIGALTHIGIGAVVIEGITIGTGAFIAAGAVVISDVGDGVRVAGVPAKPMTMQHTT